MSLQTDVIRRIQQLTSASERANLTRGGTALAQTAFLQIAHDELSGSPASASKLCLQFNIDKSTCSHLLSFLASPNGSTDSGLIRQLNDPNDHRRKLLYLSPTGKQTLKELLDIMQPPEK